MIHCIKDQDIQACLEIYNWYIENTNYTFEEQPLTYEQFENRVHRICAKYPFVVLVEEDTVVGYAYLDAFSQRSAYRKTVDLSIYVEHTKKHTGYGSQLMEAILEEAKQYDFYIIVSIVTEGNIQSEHIHQKYGFEKKAFFPNLGYKFHTWLGVTYFIKVLHDFSKN